MIRTILVLHLLVALTTALPAQQGVIDQQNDVSLNNDAFTNINNFGASRAQVVTPGIGGFLTRVEVYVGDQGTMGDLVIDVLPAPGGVPQHWISSLFTGIVSHTQIPVAAGWIGLDLPTETVLVTTGQPIAIALSTQGGANIRWYGKTASPTDPYPGGADYYFPVSGASWQLNTSPPIDWGFRTWVGNVVVDDVTPYFNDFESGARGWTVSNGLWELGTPAQSYINQAFSGSNCWMTDLDAFYPASANTALVSPWFDFSSLVSDPILGFAITWDTSVWNDGARVEIDLDDGLGWRVLGDSLFYGTGDNVNGPSTGLGGSFWGAGGQAPWHELRHALTGAAGRARTRLRVLFGADANNEAEGFAIDDIRISSSRIVVTPSQPYFQDFEEPTDAWKAGNTTYNNYTTATTPVWERGSPSNPQISPWSGSSCLATDLDGYYPIAISATITSPPCDFSTVAADPVLELALWHDLSDSSSVGADGVRVEIDLDDGNGFQTLGSLADWYDATLSNNSAPGGIGWTGQSDGWLFPRHVITGAAGKANVRIRFLLSSNIGGVAAGALIDDVRIFVPTFEGTESTLADDVRMQVRIDGERRFEGGDLAGVAPGEQFDVLTLSSEGDLVGGEYYLLCEIFLTGTSYTNVAPEVWVSGGGSTVLLDGGIHAPFFVPEQLGPDGKTFSYYYFGGAAGVSCRLQALVVMPAAAGNGVYATSDAFELTFD